MSKPPDSTGNRDALIARIQDSPEARVALIHDIATTCYAAWESWDIRTQSFDNTRKDHDGTTYGVHLAYLFAAIAKPALTGNLFELEDSSKARFRDGFLDELESLFPASHPIWLFITLTKNQSTAH